MKVYLDHSATTYIDPRVLKAMQPFLKEEYGNPSSFHNKGKYAKDAVEKARNQVAGVLNCAPEEIIFTSGGTEANNLAIQGFVKQVQCQKLKVKSHIITTKIEHPSVLEVCEYLEKEELAEITYLDVDKYGLIDLRILEKLLRPETVLVSVIYANNEIGAIQDIQRIAVIIKKYNVSSFPPSSRLWRAGKFPAFVKTSAGRQVSSRILLHIDACQAGEYLTLDVKKLGVDMMTINSSKVYGPKGVGALYVRKGVKLSPIMFGGRQESGLRPGTENVTGIVGFGEALQLTQKKEFQVISYKLQELRDYFIKELFKQIPKIRLNGHKTKRLPNNVNISVLDAEGEALILRLNEKGIYCSTGSACASGSLEPSYVIMALGVPYEVAHGSLRFTLGRETTKKEIDYVLKVLPKIVEDLRAISPVKIKKSGNL